MKKNARRTIAAVLTILMLFTVLLSACAVVLESTHDCSGDHCEICRILDTILCILRSTAFTAAVLSALRYVRLLWRSSCLTRCCVSRHKTPVTEKVLLLD